MDDTDPFYDQSDDGQEEIDQGHGSDGSSVAASSHKGISIESVVMYDDPEVKEDVSATTRYVGGSSSSDDSISYSDEDGAADREAEMARLKDEKENARCARSRGNV